jgi:hypothetical protein
MGFRPEPDEYSIVFAEDTGLYGLEMTTTDMDIDTLLRITGLVKHVGSRKEEEVTGAEFLASFNELLEIFSTSLISWNLEHPKTGLPVPATAEGMRSLSIKMFMKILDAWQTAVAGVDPTSPADSNSGGTSPVELPPMVVSSANPGS